MAGTVVPNLTDISMCENTTGWTSLGGTLGVNDPTLFDAIQGSYCCQVYAAGAGDRGAQWDFGAGTEKDFSSATNNMVIFWFAFSKKSFSANPLRIRMTDSSGNWSEWNMFTASSLPHPAWIPWALKPTVTPDTTSGTLNLSAVRYVDWRVTTGAAKTYFYWDAVRYGTGLSIKAGTSGAPATFEDFITAESTNAYGIVEKYNGIYFVQGKITIGSLTAEESTYFKDLSQVVQFKSIKGNPTGFYEIKGQNATSGSGTTEIYFGDSTSEVSGLFIKAPSAMKFKLTMSDTYITKFGFYGCSFVNADTTTLQPYNADKKIVNCNFEVCAEVLANTCIVTKCNFISSPGKALRITAGHNVTSCNFINCQTAIHHNVGGSSTSHLHIDYDKLMFTGGTYHIENSAVTPDFYIDIDRLNGSNPDVAKINNSNGGSTTLLAISVILTLTGLVAGSDVRIMNAGTITVLASTDSVAEGISSGTVVNGGTGYVVNDILTLVGGTYSATAQLKVTSVSAGVITGVEVYTVGNYTVAPIDPVSVTGGSGSGATFNVRWIFKYNYNYGAYPYIDIIILHLNYEYFRLENFKPGDTNASLPIPLREDRWYSNP